VNACRDDDLILLPVSIQQRVFLQGEGGEPDDQIGVGRHNHASWAEGCLEPLAQGDQFGGVGLGGEGKRSSGVRTLNHALGDETPNVSDGHGFAHHRGRRWRRGGRLASSNSRLHILALDPFARLPFPFLGRQFGQVNAGRLRQPSRYGRSLDSDHLLPRPGGLFHVRRRDWSAPWMLNRAPVDAQFLCPPAGGRAELDLPADTRQ